MLWRSKNGPLGGSRFRTSQPDYKQCHHVVHCGKELGGAKGCSFIELDSTLFVGLPRCAWAEREVRA